MEGKKQIKISLGTFIISIISLILIVAVVIMGIYIANQNKALEESQVAMEGKEKELQEEKINNKFETDQTKTEKLDIDSELVKKLYEYVRYEYDSDDYSDTNLGFFKENLTKENISNDLKLIVACMALIDEKEYDVIKFSESDIKHDSYTYAIYAEITVDENYIYNNEKKQYVKEEATTYEVFDDDHYYSLSIENIQKKAKEIFNTTIDIQKHSYILSDYALVYNNGAYNYFSKFPFLVTSRGNKEELIGAENEKDEIYLYSNYLKQMSVPDENGIYGPNNGYEKLCATSDEKIEITEDSKLPIYKHTFKKRADGTYYWVSTELKNKNELNIIEPQVSKEEKTVIYEYTSGDNNAAKGYPEILYVYEMNDNSIEFKYHATWNEKDISGVAKKVSEEKYIYENGSRKIELLLDSTDEDTIKVTEYENDSLSSEVNLYK